MLACWSKQTQEVNMQDPKQRPMTRFAAAAIGGLEALDQGKCPTCKGDIGEFRDRLSQREFQISGMCQKCQDSVFGGD
jgi:hypothetical protein